MIEVPIFRLDFESEFIQAFQKGAAEILLADRPIAESAFVKKFEDAFADLVASRHAVSTTSGTAALELAFRSLGVTGAVAMPNNTFSATAIAAINCGCTPILIDSEEMSLNLCVEDLVRKLESHDVKALVIVHVAGVIQKNILEIKRICDERGIPLIEDAAHAHLSHFEGRYAGTIGDLGCFSFFPTKVMTTGEGGVVTTNSDELARKLRSLKNFGRDPNDSNKILFPGGANYKISEFTGLLGYLECERVQSRIEKRNDLIKRYIENLSELGISPAKQDSGRCSYYKCVLKIKTKNREELRTIFKRKNITLTGEVYKIPLSQQVGLQSSIVVDAVTRSEEFCERHICPPLYPELSYQEIDYVCSVIKNNAADFVVEGI